MAKSSTGAVRASGLALTLQCATALIELMVVAIAAAGFDEVADASPLGRQGTIVAAVALCVVTLIGAGAAWRGVSGALRTTVAILVFVGVGIIALMAFFFLIAGGVPIVFAVLLTHAALSVALIGRTVLGAPSGVKG